MPLRSTFQALRAFAWRRSHRDFLIVFNWHQVTPLFDPLCHHKYTWTQLNDFEAGLDHLTAKFEILPLHDAIYRLNCEDLRGSCAALTFDDGDISIADYVVPVLRERNLPATFFINSAYLEGHRSYWFPILSYLCAVENATSGTVLPAALKQRAHQLRLTDDPIFYGVVRDHVERLASLVPNLGSRLVSAEWLAKLDGDQFAIGAHGHEHQRYSMMTSEWQLNDLRENVRIISQFQGYRPIFAVPFGRSWDWTTQTIRIVREQGLQVVLADGGINLGPYDAYRRIPSDGRSIRRLVAAAMSDALSEQQSSA
jgi:peptidoglycan/xylan/chitin deacetylase (PgdA/CDA1 family)